MLLEMAVGDAYGAGFECVSLERVQAHNTLEHFLNHPKHQEIQPGCYTDDTQMAIAIAEALLSRQPWTPQLLADRFVAAFKRDPRTGYSRKMYALLSAVETGTEFLARIIPRSDKSGAAMRAAPIGVLPTITAVIEHTTIQAAITHNTPDGINAAIAAALTAHYCLYQLGAKQQLGHFLEHHVPGRWSTPWQGEVPTKGIPCVQAAVTALIQSTAMSELLQTCIAFSGDVDTVAAIALAAGAHSIEITQDLPPHLIATLENKTYGRDYLIDLDQQLKQAFLEVQHTNGH